MTVTRFLKNPSRRKPHSDRGDLKSGSKRYMNRLSLSLSMECFYEFAHGMVEKIHEDGHEICSFH